MSATEVASETSSVDGFGRQHRHRRRKVLVAVMLILAAGVVVVIAVGDPFGKTTTRKGVIDNTDPTSVATVTRQGLASQTQVSATLGYAGSYTAVNQARGTLTWLPAVGRVVTQGHVLYRVSGAPVVLLYGSTPAYRSLSEGKSWSAVTGRDVAELNADLVALGYATASEIPAGTDEFTWWTKVGVEKLQAALGVTKNGILALGQVAFLPSAARVTSVSATLGTAAQPGQPVLSATSTARQVSIALNADDQSEVKVGDKVSIGLPDGRITPGVIRSVGTVATAPAANSSSNSPTITVLVKPTHPRATGTWDQAPVNVTITTAGVHDALVVPVDALLAQANGGYAVEVVGANGIHHLIRVSLGLFDDADGLVQITGSKLSVGQRIVVPAL